MAGSYRSRKGGKARQRRELIRELFGLIEEGDSHANGTYVTHEAVNDWEARTSKLIQVAFGNDKRRNFQLKEADLSEPYRKGNPEASEERIRAMELLDRLKSLRFEANRFDPPPPELHPDFDIERYRRWLHAR